MDVTGGWTGTFDGQEGTYYTNATNLTSFGTPFYTFFNATTTTALAEGTNLYYTSVRDLRHSTTSADWWETQQTARTADDISDNTTTNLSEGTNLYYTLNRDIRYSTTSSDYWFTQQTTTGLTQGTNLYYTAAQATTDCATITGGAGLCDGDDATGAGGGTFPFTPTT